MEQDTIKCPKCGEVIQISKVITQNIEEKVKQKYEKQIIEWKQTELDSIKKHQIQEAKKAFETEVTDLKKQLEEKNNEIKEAEGKALNLRKKELELNEKEKSLVKQFEAKENELKENFENEKKLIEDSFAQS